MEDDSMVSGNIDDAPKLILRFRWNVYVPAAAMAKGFCTKTPWRKVPVPTFGLMTHNAAKAPEGHVEVLVARKTLTPSGVPEVCSISIMAFAVTTTVPGPGTVIVTPEPA